jgi:hypothetical protein
MAFDEVSVADLAGLVFEITGVTGSTRTGALLSIQLDEMGGVGRYEIRAHADVPSAVASIEIFQDKDGKQ